VHAESAKGPSEEDDDDDPAPDLWQYFDSSAFTGFDDTAEGFFQVYSRVFADIDRLEEGFEMEDQYHDAAPPFGDHISVDLHCHTNAWAGLMRTQPHAHSTSCA
jgi:hypothetical protein